MTARQISPAPFTEPTAAKAATVPVEGLRAEQPYAEVNRWLSKTEGLESGLRERLENTLDDLADDPGSPELRMTLGEELLDAEAYELAIAPLKDAFFLRPGNFKAAALLADAYVQAERRQEALALARRLVGDNPHSHERWLFRAEVARRAGLTDEAMSAARRTLLIRPEVTEAKAVLGFIYADKGNIALARKLLEEVAESPRIQSFAVKHRLGRMALDEEDYTSALRYFRESVEANHGYAPARNDLGLTYVKLGRWDEAKSQFQKAVEADPELAEAQVNLANLYIDAELDGEAKRALRAAAKVGTDPAAFFLAAGRLYSLDISTSTGRTAAMAYFSKAKKLVDDETRGQIERAMEKFASLPPAAVPVDEPVQAADIPEPVSTEPSQRGRPTAPDEGSPPVQPAQKDVREAEGTDGSAVQDEAPAVSAGQAGPARRDVDGNEEKSEIDSFLPAVK